MVICFTKHLLDAKQQLSKIWLAAHWEKKIKRTEIFKVDIEKCVQEIVEAEIILDLRLSGHLLVGIVKIHSRKTKYLLSECSSIFFQVKIFHTDRIDLPDNKQTAAVSDITLTEYFDDHVANAGNDILDAILSSNQGRLEDITLKETMTERLTLLNEDDTNFAFHEGDEPFDITGGNLMSMCNGLEIPQDMTGVQDTIVEQNKSAHKPTRLAVYKQIDIIMINTTEQEGLCADPPRDQDEFDFGNFNSEVAVTEIPESFDLSAFTNGNVNNVHITSSNVQSRNLLDRLNLEPLKTVSSRNSNKAKSRKRKLCIDYVKCLSEKDLHEQILDTSDIVTLLDMAPNTKRLMILREIGRVEKILCSPVLHLQNPKLLKMYQRNLKTLSCEDFDSSPEGEPDESDHKRKKLRRENSEEYVVNENVTNNFEDSDLDIGNNQHLNGEADLPSVHDDFINTTTAHSDILGSGANSSLLMESLPSDKFRLSDEIYYQCTQESKTSEERWEYALQGRLIQILLILKQLFKEKPVLLFSDLVTNNKKLWVVQKFFCLLMLKKLKVISLEQSKAYGEIYISQDLNFVSACSKFCTS